MNTYTDFEGITHQIPTREELLAESVRRPLILGGPALPVGTPGPRRAAEPTDAELLAALKASPDFAVMTF